MSNINQAPKIKYNGEKNRDTKGWGKAIRTHELEAALMNGLGERDMAQLKVMLFLTGNAEGYGVAEKTIMERCKISESGYKNARKKLIEKGWITLVASQFIIVNYDVILKGQPENTPKKDDEKIKGQSEKTPQGYSEKSPSGQSENTYNNISNSINNNIIQKNPKEEENKVVPKEEGTQDNPILVEMEWLKERHNEVSKCANGLFYYYNKFYKAK